MLGPLAVDPSCRKLGIGAALMNHALAAATAHGHGAVILLGDAPYYARFGFTAAKTADLSLPGPFERERLLGLELRDGALDGAAGMIVPDRHRVAGSEESSPGENAAAETRSANRHRRSGTRVFIWTRNPETGIRRIPVRASRARNDGLRLCTDR